MYGTYCKHCSLIPPLVFNNNLTLLRCGYMCVGTLVHISRHLGKTSNNNNKRCQLWIHCMLCHICLYRVLLRIFGFMIIILYMFISCLLLVFYPACLLLLSDHIMSLPYLMSFAVYLLAPTCLCSRHGFQCMIMIRFYRYSVLIFARHLAFASPLAGEF